jgi:hypothetical protein
VLPYSTEEVIQAFESAENLNAALKSFLKREASAGAHIEPFAKAFRHAVKNGRAGAIGAFVEANHARHAALFLGVARYAFARPIEAVAGSIIDTFAEEFNATYTDGPSNQGEPAPLIITNPDRFAGITSEVLLQIDSGLTGAGVTPNNFFRNVVLTAIFEPRVLTEVSKVIAR